MPGVREALSAPTVLEGPIGLLPIICKLLLKLFDFQHAVLASMSSFLNTCSMLWVVPMGLSGLMFAGSIPVARSKILHNIAPRSRVVTERSIRVCFGSI